MRRRLFSRVLIHRGSSLLLSQMAVDIALHHECLRASLKKCNGYEIATEGDSFKCAFRTPEDAISWSILAQVKAPPLRGLTAQCCYGGGMAGFAEGAMGALLSRRMVGKRMGGTEGDG